MQKLKGLVLLVHPLPILGVCAMATALGLSLAQTRAHYALLAVLVAAIFFSQLIVGSTNDIVDLEADKSAQPWKPLVAGWITTRDAYFFVGGAIFCLSITLFFLKPIVQVCVLIGTFAGLLHNFWLKGTRLDWLAYALGFAILPLTVWLQLERWQVTHALLFVPASFLLFAVTLARDLPDIEGDRAAGKKSLAVRLGAQKTIRVVCACLLLAALAAAVTLTRAPLNLNLFASGLALYVLIALVLCYRYFSNASPANWRVNFRLAVLGTVTLITFGLFALES